MLVAVDNHAPRKRRHNALLVGLGIAHVMSKENDVRIVLVKTRRNKVGNHGSLVLLRRVEHEKARAGGNLLHF